MFLLGARTAGSEAYMGRDHFPRVHDVVWVQGVLDSFHHP